MSEAPLPAPAGRAVAWWLVASASSVVAVLLVGGITRLTHSGLSIVQWQPLVGVVPPLDAQDWARLFDAYRASPQFQRVQPGLDLDGFRAIFWWEYGHRLLARLAALVYLVPFLVLLARRRLATPLAWRLAGIFCLGGLQGAVGWFMVASGLVGAARVDPLRLAAHLGIALAILSALLWTAADLWFAASERRPVSALARLALAAVFLMALSGALVAGSQAGWVYNTFPRMNDGWLPPDPWALTPPWRNLTDNLGTIQFLHRALACAVLGVLVVFAAQLLRAVRTRAARRAAMAMLAALALQLGLGVATLLSGARPVLASCHQAGAVLLFVATLAAAYAGRLRQAPAHNQDQARDSTSAMAPTISTAR